MWTACRSINIAGENQLSIDERLTLFAKVCEAVHYAHQNLVVHCDLKPSNILVLADGNPKLLDFGIAKLLDPDRDGTTYRGPLPAAPEYASPEQRAANRSARRRTSTHSA